MRTAKCQDSTGGLTKAAAALAAFLLPVSPAAAVEGGSGAYLLGSRDTFAGIAPPPGTYFSLDVFHLDGQVPYLAIGGVIVTQATTSATVAMLNFTQSFAEPLWGGQPYVTLTVPVVSGNLGFYSSLGNGLSGGFENQKTNFGDLVITPSLGFHAGNAHWVYAASIFAPTGYYEKASVNIPARSIDALSFGKNRWSIAPTAAYTWFNPQTGFEVSASGSVTISAKNTATDYQTAPEAVLEAAVMQHLKSGFAFGLTGYGYQQLGEDSGSGAEALKAATNAASLEAQVYGLGPIISYSTRMGDRSVSMKLKYLSEFDARRRFESDVIAASFSINF
jgi:hypothetical protein